jgi:hypothetical protein
VDPSLDIIDGDDRAFKAAPMTLLFSLLLALLFLLALGAFYVFGRLRDSLLCVLLAVAAYAYWGSFPQVIQAIRLQECDRVWLLLQNRSKKDLNMIYEQLRYCPQHVMLRYEYARLLYEQGDRKEALLLWEELLKEPALEAAHGALSEMIKRGHQED